MDEPALVNKKDGGWIDSIILEGEFVNLEASRQVPSDEKIKFEIRENDKEDGLFVVCTKAQAIHLRNFLNEFIEDV